MSEMTREYSSLTPDALERSKVIRHSFFSLSGSSSLEIVISGAKEIKYFLFIYLINLFIFAFLMAGTCKSYLA